MRAAAGGVKGGGLGGRAGLGGHLGADGLLGALLLGDRGTAWPGCSASQTGSMRWAVRMSSKSGGVPMHGRPAACSMPITRLVPQRPSPATIT